MAGIKLRKFSMLNLIKNRSAVKLHLCRTFMLSLKMVSKKIIIWNNIENREISKKVRRKLKVETKIIRRNRIFRLIITNQIILDT